MYETPDALTKHLPERFRKAVQFVQIGRHTRISILDKITDFIPNPTFDRVAAPGAHEKFYAGNNPEGLSLREMTGEPIDSIPAFRNPAARIDMMNAHGVDEALVYPTLANLVEHSAAEDPELVVAIIHALNQWMLETWGYTYDNRLYMTPVITAALVDDARRELAYVLENGAKAVLMKPAPVKGYRGWRSPALPEFDPFWSDVEQAGIPVVLHASQPPLDSYIKRWEPAGSGSFFEMGAFRWIVLGHREIADMLTSLICHGTLTRFPKLRIASVENGSAWIRQLFEDFE
ncbi:amidohydrolase family protein, partial [Mycobacterium avium]